MSMIVPGVYIYDIVHQVVGNLLSFSLLKSLLLSKYQFFSSCPSVVYYYFYYYLVEKLVVFHFSQRPSACKSWLWVGFVDLYQWVGSYRFKPPHWFSNTHSDSCDTLEDVPQITGSYLTFPHKSCTNGTYPLHYQTKY